MRRAQRITTCGVMILVVFFATAFSATVGAGSLLYKNYAVRRDEGFDILCEPYLVQNNDYILKLFRESGEISHTDFPEFLRIFSHINPNIPDINRIQAGQRILIPLKKLSPESLPGQGTGVVSIPFMNISTLPELLKSNASEYIIEQGDTLSKILSRSFGNVSSKAYQEACQIFKIINPDVSNPNMIRTGQTLWIPRTSVSNQPWYASLFDTAGDLISGEKFTPGNQSPGPGPPPLPPVDPSSLEKAAALLEGRALNRGLYYFPRPGADDLKLDLSLFPVLELPNNYRALIVPPSATSGSGIPDSDVAAIKSYWKTLSILPVDPNAPVEEILEAFFNSDPNNGGNNNVSFSDNGVTISVRARWWLKQTQEPSQSLSPANPKVGLIPSMDTEAGNMAIILKYLAKHGIVLKAVKNEENKAPESSKFSVLLPVIIPSSPPKALVAALMSALDLPFSAGVAISFPYGGIQIPAVSNLISTREGLSILVDFGELYGEAIEAIEKSGLSVVRIIPQQTPYDTIRTLLTATGHSYEENPTFDAARAPAAFNVKISIPGFLVSAAGVPKILLSRVLLDPALIRLINERGIKIFRIDEYSPGR